MAGMKKCVKTPYPSRKKAREQLRFRNAANQNEGGTAYYCREHRGWHISHYEVPIIHESLWRKIRRRKP